MENLQVKNALMEALVDMVTEKQNQAQYKHDLPSGFTLTTNLMHGPTGIFGYPGIDRDVFATRVKPRGMLSVLPARASIDDNPITAYLTGFTDESGSEPSTQCTECVKAGNIKACRQGTVFGLICRETDEINIANIGRRNNRSEFYDLRLVNDPLLNDSPLWVPSSVPSGVQEVLNREVLARWLTLGVAFENKLAQLVFEGNPSNNVGTGYAEYLGLESLVTTGHTDVIDSTSCPSLDSDVKDMNYASIENDAATIFAYMTMVYRFVKHNAQVMGFMPVQWAWVIKDSLFRKLSDYWPCVYASFRCNSSASNPNNTDAMEMRRMSDDLYNNRYLVIDGERIPVVIDDAIPYEKSGDAGSSLPAGTFASDVYLIPMTVRGGLPVTYMEYFDYSGPNGVMQGISDGRANSEFWTDGGRFLWTFSRTRFCMSWTARIEPRLRLMTPHLAGRLQNIQWTPLQMFREPFPTQGYFVDGGITTSSQAPYDLTS